VAGSWSVVKLRGSVGDSAASSCAEFVEFTEHDKRKPKHSGFFISKVRLA
jgi:hypothetical protein